MIARLLILHPGAIGDVLLSLQAIKEIKNTNQSVSIHLSAKSEAASFLKETGQVEEYSDFESPFYLSLYSDQLEDKLINFLRSFESIYLFTNRPDSQAVRNLLSIHPKTIIVRTLSEHKTHPIHVSLYRTRQINPHCDSIEPLSIKIPHFVLAQTKIELSSSGYKDSMRLVTIHPGSGSKEKNIDMETFLKLSDCLIDSKGAFVVFLTGWAEGDEIINQIAGFLSKRQGRCTHYNRKSLIDAAAIIKLSQLYLGNDSGLSHLASKVADKLIIFFKSTDPVIWAPLSRGIKIIDSNYEIKAREHIDLLWS